MINAATLLQWKILRQIFISAPWAAIVFASLIQERAQTGRF